MKEKFEKICKACKAAWEKVKGLVRIDGLLHICVSAIIMFALGWIHPLVIGVAVTLVIGIGKEVYDYLKVKADFLKYDWNNCYHDIICDCIGIFVGLMLVWLNMLG